MKKYNLILTILVLVALSLAVLRAVLENTFVSSGIMLDKLNSQINVYKIQNDSLEERYFSKTSLTYLATEAAKLGFGDAKNNFVLTSPLPLAAR